VEADLAGVHEHKADVLDAVAPRCRLERHGVDLSDPASRRQLLDQVGTGPPTLVLTEGVLPYLAEADVAGLATDLAAHPAFRWWVVDIVAPGFLTLTDRVAGRRLAAAGASLRFAPTQGPAFFARVGWDATEVRSSWLEQRRLDREPTLFRALWTATPPRAHRFYRDMGQFVLLRRRTDG